MTESLKKVVCSLILVCGFIFFSTSVQAEQGPSEVVREAISKVQEAGNPSPMVDYVDWSGIYAKMPQKSKELIKVESESELKDYYREILKSPSDAMVKLMSGKISEKIGRDKAELGEQILAKVKERMKIKEDEIKDKIKNSKYTIGDAMIDDDVARVPVTYVYNSESKSEQLKLIKKDGTWLMSNLGDSFGASSVGK